MTYVVVAADGWVTLWPVMPKPDDFEKGARCFAVPTGFGVYNLAELQVVEWVMTRAKQTQRDAVTRIW